MESMRSKTPFPAFTQRTVQGGRHTYKQMLEQCDTYVNRGVTGRLAKGHGGKLTQERGVVWGSFDKKK